MKQPLRMYSYNTCCRESTLRLYKHKTSQLLSLKMDASYWTITFQLKSKHFDAIKILHVFFIQIGVRLQTQNIIARTVWLSAALTDLLSDSVWLYIKINVLHSSSN